MLIKLNIQYLLLIEIYQTHINKLKSKLTSALFAINRTKHILPHEALKTLYFAHIQSHLTYGIHAWGHSTFKYSNLKKEQFD